MSNKISELDTLMLEYANILNDSKNNPTFKYNIENFSEKDVDELNIDKLLPENINTFEKFYWLNNNKTSKSVKFIEYEKDKKLKNLYKKWAM